MNVDKLNRYVDGFISEKRTLGYKYKTEEYKIKSFARFVQDNNVGNCLSKEGMLLWTDTAKTPLARNSRISILRQFSLFLARIGEDVYFFPDAAFSIKHKKFCPYIFSEEELVKMFHAADSFGQFVKIPYSQYSFPLILRMLYGCGLRISEALSLKLKQVDLQKSTLLIENTKFFKDRRVPMHANSTKKVF